MFGIKLFKTLNFFIHSPADFKKTIFFLMFLMFFYFGYSNFAFYNCGSSYYKSDVYKNLSNSFLMLWSAFMIAYPIIYCVIFLDKIKIIEKLMRLFSCNQLKNNLIVMSFAATVLALFPLAVLTITYADLYAEVSGDYKHYENVIYIIFSSPFWLLFNIVLVQFLMFLFKQDVVICAMSLHILFFLGIGKIIDLNLSVKYGYNFTFYSHSGPVYVSLKDMSSFSENYLCYWSAIYLFGSSPKKLLGF